MQDRQGLSIKKEFSGEVTIKLIGTMESTMGMGKMF